MRVIFVVRDIKMQHVGVMLLAAILAQHGFEVEAVEADLEEIRRRIIRSDGGKVVLAYSTPTVYYHFYWRLNRRLKQEFGDRIFSVFGGPHPTFSPEIIRHKGVDAICVGEGDEAFPELLHALADDRDITRIRNIYVKHDGRIYRNPLRPLVEDLDSLPFPDRSVFGERAVYYQHRAAVLTSRGCPFDCAYCFNHAYKALYGPSARRIRQRSVPNVIEELRQIKANPHVRLIVFQDDTLIVNPRWIEEFAEAYAREIGIPFYAKVHPNFVTERTARALGRAGCVCAAMGIETADERLRREVFNRPVSTRQIIRAADALHAAGVRVQSFNIIGIPTGSLEADFRTLQLNIRCKVDYAEVTMLNPYPGTRIYEFTKERGLLPERFDGYLDPTMPSVNLVSHIRFPSKKEKHRVENLHKLFGYGVEFPKLLPVIRRLIDLPPNRLFANAMLAYRAYCTYFRSMPVGWKGFLQRILAGRWSLKHYS